MAQGDTEQLPGDTFGLHSFADVSLSEPHAEVLETTRVGIITHEAYARIEQRRPQVAARLLRGLYRELARSTAPLHSEE